MTWKAMNGLAAPAPQVWLFVPPPLQGGVNQCLAQAPTFNNATPSPPPSQIPEIDRKYFFGKLSVSELKSIRFVRAVRVATESDRDEQSSLTHSGA